jgi:hypothetical protein
MRWRGGSKESISLAELWALDRARQRGHLLAERQILERNPTGVRGTSVQSIEGARQGPSACVILPRMQRQNQPTGAIALWKRTIDEDQPHDELATLPSVMLAGPSRSQ